MKEEHVENLDNVKYSIKAIGAVSTIIALMLVGISILFTVALHANKVKGALPDSIHMGCVVAMGGIILITVFYTIMRNNNKE